MLNFTLTITAAPELLAVISNFTGAITNAKVVTVPRSDLNYEVIKTAHEQANVRPSSQQPAQQPSTFPLQNSYMQQSIPNQQIVQASIPAYSQGSPVPVNQIQVSQQLQNNPTQIQSQIPNSIIQAPQQFGQQTMNPITPVQASVVPTSAQTYTKEQLAVAAAEISDTGRIVELINLLGAFGVQTLNDLPKERYGEFATKLRALGAKI